LYSNIATPDQEFDNISLRIETIVIDLLLLESAPTDAIADLADSIWSEAKRLPRSLTLL
jgi:hypothetical protein